jgi:hypothetical protein
MNAMEREPGFLQPSSEPGDRRGVVIVEVRPGGEHFHCFEPVRGNLFEVLAAEPLVVEQVRRDTKSHGRNHPLYNGVVLDARRGVGRA